MNNNHQQRLKERWVLGALILNLFLSVLKLLVGVMTGSLGLIAEAIHSFSDLIASVVSFIGIKITAKKSKDFPYGLYKVENIAAIIISFFLFFASYEILKEAFLRHEDYEIKNPEYAIAVMLIAMVLTFFYSRFEKRAGEKLNSPVLIADAEHIWADFLSSLIVLVGLVSVYFGYNLDKYTAAIVSLFIFKSGFDILKESIKVLLDYSLSFEDLKKIKDIILKNPAVVDIKDIKGRSAGSYKFVEGEILLHNMSLREAHKIVDEISDEIKREIQNVESVVLHYEPARQEGLRVGVLCDENQNIKDFETSNVICIYDIGKDSKILSNYKINIEKDTLSKLLSKVGLDILISKNHPNSFDIRFLLSKSSIMVWETEKDGLTEALNEVIESWKEFIKGEVLS